MSNLHQISSMNAEVLRLKNRVRQQKYRARKREEKAKRNGETMLPVDLLISNVPNVTDGLPALRNVVGLLNPETIEAQNGTKSVDFENEDTDSFHEGCGPHPIVAESFQVKCIMGHQHQQEQQEQQHNDAQFFGTDAEDDANIAPGDLRTYQSHMILQPLNKMENKYAINTLKIQDGYVMKHLDQREHSRGHNDIMTRRLKNRERQRRYRARKRLEIDMRNAHLINHSTPLQVESQLNEGMNKCLTRVLCQRDWKKDARRAYLSREPNVTPTGFLLHALTVAGEDQEQSFPSEIKAEPLLEGEFQSKNPVSLIKFEVNGVTYGQRDWKAAARNKVD